MAKSQGLDKSILINNELVGQVGKKFICIKAWSGDEKLRDAIRSKLFFLDQHAIHERIRLEHLIEKYFSRSSQTIPMDQALIHYLETPIFISVSEKDAQLISTLRENLGLLGIRFTIKSSVKDDIISENCCHIIVETVPNILLNKLTLKSYNKTRGGNCDRTKIKAVVRDIFKDCIREYKNYGKLGKIPRTIFESLCSSACHGAIKFGQGLEYSQMRGLIQNLANCRFPFVCAHGRPSIISICELKNLSKPETFQPYKLNRIPRLKSRL